ncbi:MAG: maleylacetoacetate isomerase [Sphingomonadaceae bacterium]
MTRPTLHGYYRSSASYRVRIALNLKGIAYDDVFHHLRKGEQSAPSYLAINPQGLVPTLSWNGLELTQSLAICEYLDEVQPDPALMPGDPLQRARIRAFAQVIACDIHPLQNLKVLKRLKALGQDQDSIDAWARWVIEDGLGACAKLLAAGSGPYCFGSSVTLADICLIPQLANARRFGVDISKWPQIDSIEEACLALDAFQRARPENQSDAE